MNHLKRINQLIKINLYFYEKGKKGQGLENGLGLHPRNTVKRLVSSVQIPCSYSELHCYHTNDSFRQESASNEWVTQRAKEY
mmetsp:Transcript_2141/g.3304  ORF Transcript_2141/g.3304 Transcript_2141/m.3304 type:complete len:82 (+) Transcript_2141:1389-1634(+)